MMDESMIESYVESSKPIVNVIAKDLAQNSTHPMKIRPLTIFYEKRKSLSKTKCLQKSPLMSLNLSFTK